MQLRFFVPARILSRVICFTFVLSPLGLVGCGGDKETKKNAQEVVNQAFSGKNKKTASGKISVNFRVDLRGIPSIRGPVQMQLGGPFISGDDKRLPQFDLDFTVNTPGGSLAAGAVLTGNRGFLKLQGAPFSLSNKLFRGFQQSYLQARAKSRTSRTQTPSLATLGVHPQTWLRNVKSRGEAEVEGVNVQRIQADLDGKKMLAELADLLQNIRKFGLAGQGQTAGISLDTQDAIVRAIQRAKLDVSIGKEDSRLRKLSFDIDFVVPEEFRAKLGGLQRGKVLVELGLSQLDVPQQVQVPSNAQPLSRLTAAIKQLQSNGVAGGLAKKLGSQTNSAPSQQSSAYDTCIQAAGQDIAKIQQCAELLNK